MSILPKWKTLTECRMGRTYTPAEPSGFAPWVLERCVVSTVQSLHKCHRYKRETPQIRTIYVQFRICSIDGVWVVAIQKQRRGSYQAI